MHGKMGGSYGEASSGAAGMPSLTKNVPSFFSESLSNIGAQINTQRALTKELRSRLDQVMDTRESPEHNGNQAAAPQPFGPVTQVDFRLEELNMELRAAIAELEDVIKRIRL